MQGRISHKRRVVAGVVDVLAEAHDAHDHARVVALLLDDGDIDILTPIRQRVVMNSDGALPINQVLRYS